MRSSTVMHRHRKALTHAVISASRARASLPAISTPTSSLQVPAATWSRHIRVSCMRRTDASASRALNRQH